MREPTAIIESVKEVDIHEINELEVAIVESEDDADEKLWQQAAEVVKHLDGGMSQRALAKEWTNVRTGEAYSYTHVQIVAKVYDKFTCQDPRPRFRDAYNQIANEKTAHVSKNTGEYEWYTPKEYISAAKQTMGDIDLDPASTKEANELVGAKSYYTKQDDGLTKKWRGRVWMNPPYSHPEIEGFCSKLHDNIVSNSITEACVLVNNATETQWFQSLISGAACMCFPSGRVKFWHPEKETSAPLQGQSIIYFGPHVETFIDAFSSFGFIVKCL